MMSVGAIIIAFLVLGLLSVAVISLIRDGRSGRCSCGSNCGRCGGACRRPMTIREPDE